MKRLPVGVPSLLPLETEGCKSSSSPIDSSAQMGGFGSLARPGSPGFNRVPRKRVTGKRGRRQGEEAEIKREEGAEEQAGEIPSVKEQKRWRWK